MRPVRMALAARLALLFALVTLVVFSIAGVHLYRALDSQVQRRDDLALIGTAEIMRHQLGQGSGADAAHRVINLLNAAYGPSGITLALKDAEGHLLAGTTPNAELLPSDAPVALERPLTLSDVREWYEGDVRRGRLVVAEGRPGNGSDAPRVLSVAREESYTGLVVDAHGRDLLLTLVAGALATGLLGYWVVHRALRPVHALAAAAEAITATELGERLRADEAPQELEVLVRAFNRVLDRLEESFHRLGRFSADLAHDLRTPLSNLMIANQVVLNRTRGVAEYQAVLASNIEEFERLSRMIEEMLFIAKADNPATVIVRTPVELRDEVDKVVEFYAPLAEDRGLSIRCSGAGRVLGDSVLLQRAIHNLLSNAIRYSTADAAIDVQIACPTVGRVELSVANEGPGIAPDDAPHVFDRFYRADTARQNSSEGSGLGLAIVKSIAMLHGGEVRVASVPGRRTTFVLTLQAA